MIIPSACLLNPLWQLLRFGQFLPNFSRDSGSQIKEVVMSLTNINSWVRCPHWWKGFNGNSMTVSSAWCTGLADVSFAPVPKMWSPISCFLVGGSQKWWGWSRSYLLGPRGVLLGWEKGSEEDPSEDDSGFEAQARRRQVYRKAGFIGYAAPRTTVPPYE